MALTYQHDKEVDDLSWIALDIEDEGIRNLDPMYLSMHLVITSRKTGLRLVAAQG